MTPDMVRAAARQVAESAGFVRILPDAIPACARRLRTEEKIVTTLDPQTHFIDPANPEKTAAYVLALDSVNFGSGYFHVAQQAGVDLEYDTIAGNLKAAFEKGICATPQEWARATARECHGVFGIPAGAHPALDRLMALFASHLNETGGIILRQYDGRALKLVEAARGSAVRLVDIVSAWDGFADVAAYKGARVPILKRAQILAADLHLALGGLFTDMDELTIFADNMVPHVLRHDGVLAYEEGLVRRIDAGEMIVAGSPEETEIRCAAIHAVELIKQAARAQGGDLTAVNIDHMLWHRGYTPAFYALPRHKTMTVWY